MVSKLGLGSSSGRITVLCSWSSPLYSLTVPLSSLSSQEYTWVLRQLVRCWGYLRLIRLRTKKGRILLLDPSNSSYGNRDDLRWCGPWPLGPSWCLTMHSVIYIAFLLNLQFVSSPKCQSILNEIIYYEWPYWQNMSRITKLAWFFLQLVFVAVSSIVYIPIRLARKFSCCNKDDNTWWEFRELYEHPYSKFINHTMWYLGFLSFILLTSFEHEFGTKAAGLVHIGKSWQAVYSWKLRILWSNCTVKGIMSRSLVRISPPGKLSCNSDRSRDRRTF